MPLDYPYVEAPVAEGAFGGVDPNTIPTVLAPKMGPARWLYDRDSQTLYTIVHNGAPGTAPTWMAVNGGAALGLSKYWVAPIGNQPNAPYHDIQDAIDAATTDGHGVDSPAFIPIWPASYTGDVDLPPGIALIAAWDQRPGNEFPPTQLNGDLTMDFTVSGSCYVRGILVTGAVTASGAGIINVDFDRCWFLSTVSLPFGASFGFAQFTQCALLPSVGPAIEMAATAASTLNLYETGMFSVENAIEVTGQNIGLSFYGCEAITGATASVVLDGNDITMNAVRSSLNGPVIATNGALVRGEWSQLFGDALSAMTLAPASGGRAHHWRYGILDCSGGTHVAGSGIVELTGVTTITGAVPLRAATITLLQRATNFVKCPIQSFDGAGPHSPGQEVQTALVDTGDVAGIVLNLPDVTLGDSAQPFIVQNTNGGATGTIVLTPGGGQTINGAATLTMAARAGGKQSSILFRVPPTGWVRVGGII